LEPARDAAALMALLRELQHTSDQLRDGPMATIVALGERESANQQSNTGTGP
jgi:hypothetical protein